MGNPSEWASEVKKGLFRIFQIFFRKIMVFQWKKRKKKNLLILFAYEVPKLVGDINLYYFYHTGPSNGLNWPKYGIYGIFSDFWLLSLRAKFRGYRVPDLPFSARNIKIQCLEHPWVPLTHFPTISAYPLKMASKFKIGDFLYFLDGITQKWFEI